MAMFHKAAVVLISAIFLICYVDCGLCKATVLVIASSLLRSIFNTPDFHPESLKGKRVVVTGSSSGIGENLAYEYSKLGAKVLVTGRRENLLQKVAEKCTQLGAQQVEYVVADMNIEESRAKVIEAAKENFGGLDILIVNHIAMQDNASKMPGVRNMLENAFVSYVDLANQALPLLQQSSGYLGVTSSIAGKMPFRSVPMYCACKFALEGYFGAARQHPEYTKSGISVSLIFLGLIATELVMPVIKSGHFSEWQAASPQKTAVAILKGIATRTEDIYYPFGYRLVCELYKICPCLARFVLEKFFNMY